MNAFKHCLKNTAPPNPKSPNHSSVRSLFLTFSIQKPGWTCSQKKRCTNKPILTQRWKNCSVIIVISYPMMCFCALLQVIGVESHEHSSQFQHRASRQSGWVKAIFIGNQRFFAQTMQTFPFPFTLFYFYSKLSFSVRVYVIFYYVSCIFLNNGVLSPMYCTCSVSCNRFCFQLHVFRVSALCACRHISLIYNLLFPNLVHTL